MPTCCCVPQCGSRHGGHKFPKEAGRRKRWIVAIRRDKWSPTEGSVVCHNHFTEEDFVATTVFGDYCKAKILKPGVVPSQFRWTKPCSPAVIARRNRAKRKEISNNSSPAIFPAVIAKRKEISNNSSPAIFPG
ncbi:hypothetical protein Pmani_005164 [Petrolisthes manimaculis]|uniref:THAP-type domain-containing protein n=1 Tax=Petrolisthes manimaculis TaxID=1843537 RepID=A0AAE1QD70_9EUCA|nr:hypothetical protein Pmani_005164 [Petrolisthes manimaculis]